MYCGQSNKCPYPAPEMKIKEFINKLKDDLNVDTKIVLNLFSGKDRLLPSGMIHDYGIKPGDELRLEESVSPVSSNVSQVSLNICLQTLAGQQYEYTMSYTATLDDLFSTIDTDKSFSFTSTFPILFNHRMHLWKSKELLPCYLKLHKGNNNSQYKVPDFYLFECQRQFETHHLEYQKAGHSEIFFAQDFWQPLGCVKQNEMAMSTFLISLKVLKAAFLSQPEPEVDAINYAHIPKFLIILRQFLFPPACLALYHVLEGECFQF
jgi:hypothetical protein